MKRDFLFCLISFVSPITIEIESTQNYEIRKRGFNDENEMEITYVNVTYYRFISRLWYCEAGKRS